MLRHRGLLFPTPAVLRFLLILFTVLVFLFPPAPLLLFPFHVCLFLIFQLSLLVRFSCVVCFLSLDVLFFFLSSSQNSVSHSLQLNHLFAFTSSYSSSSTCLLLFFISHLPSSSPSTSYTLPLFFLSSSSSYSIHLLLLRLVLVLLAGPRDLL